MLTEYNDAAPVFPPYERIVRHEADRLAEPERRTTSEPERGTTSKVSSMR